MRAKTLCYSTHARLVTAPSWQRMTATRAFPSRFAGLAQPPMLQCGLVLEAYNSKGQVLDNSQEASGIEECCHLCSMTPYCNVVNYCPDPTGW
jgi:hypothetical protein